MNKLDQCRKEIAKHGLLADATPPEPSTPPLSEEGRAEAILQYYLENLRRRIEEEPGMRAAINLLLKKKRGPKTKWGLLQKAALISEVRSRLPKRGNESMTNKASITAICEELAGLPHWSNFLGVAENGAETLRQRYTQDSKDRKLVKIASHIGRPRDYQGEATRAAFVKGILGQADEQQSGQQLDQIMNLMVRKTG